jgi:hypothetical protein
VALGLHEQLETGAPPQIFTALAAMRGKEERVRRFDAEHEEDRVRGLDDVHLDRLNRFRPLLGMRNEPVLSEKLHARRPLRWLNTSPPS